MKKMFVGILLAFSMLLLSCTSTPHKESHVNDIVPPVNCDKAPKIWWGKTGENPSNNDLWKCYDWALITKDLFSQ